MIIKRMFVLIRKNNKEHLLTIKNEIKKNRITVMNIHDVKGSASAGSKININNNYHYKIR